MEFPSDKLGCYVTLKILKKLPNGDRVQIDLIKSTNQVLVIPKDLIQDDEANLDEFPDRFHFKKMKDVTVRYLRNENGEEKTISLQKLKQVQKCFTCVYILSDII